MDFDSRLERAIERGHRARESKGRQQANQALSEEELKNRHTHARLELSEHIENCLQQLVDHFPGFRFQTVVGEEGWGAKVSRDDIAVAPRRQSKNVYSRLEMAIRPFSSTQIVELSAKAAIRNKEIFSRSHYQMLAEVDLDSFRELIDLWVLEYAERFSADT